MNELPLADARNQHTELVTAVEKTHERVTITKHGHPAAMPVSPEDLASLEGTLDILSHRGTGCDSRGGSRVREGEVTTGEETAPLMEERRRRASGAA